MGNVGTQLSPVQQSRIWRVQITWPNGKVNYFGKFSFEKYAIEWIEAHARLTEPVAEKAIDAAQVCLCPICKSPSQEFARTGDAIGFYCTIHGHFKVADTIAVDEYYTRAQWEVALRAAKHKAMEGEWPVIRRRHFFR
jgi:hypothetical protein